VSALTTNADTSRYHYCDGVNWFMCVEVGCLVPGPQPAEFSRGGKLLYRVVVPNR